MCTINNNNNNNNDDDLFYSFKVVERKKKLRNGERLLKTQASKSNRRTIREKVPKAGYYKRGML